jgi:hypothetical protein
MSYTYKYLRGETDTDPMALKCDYVMRSDGTLVHKELNQAYLAWVAEGNTPTPADEGTQ